MSRSNRKWTLLGLAVFVLAGQAVCRGEAILYLADGQTNTLYSVDTGSGLATAVGAFGIDASFVGLASNPDGGLLMTSALGPGNQEMSGLYQVDTATGIAALIGNTGVVNISGLAYDTRRDELFGGSGATDSLYRVSRTTGTANLVGSLGVNVGGNGLAYDATADRLLLTDGITDQLYSVDQLTGAATSIGNTSLPSTVALAYHPETNELFGVDAISDELVRFNLTTGQATTVGNLGFDALNIGLAFEAVAIPEPSSMAMLSVIACVLVGRRRRRMGTCERN